MKMKKPFAAVMAAVLLATSATGVSAGEDKRQGKEIAFKDTSGMTWVKDSIGRMKSKGIFQGYGDGLFQPYKPVTRLQSVITVVRLLGLEEEAKAMKTGAPLPFQDAKSINEKYYGYLATAIEAGVLEADGSAFNGNKPANRVWVSELLVRSLGLIGEAEAEAGETPEFTDTAVLTATQSGFVNVAAAHDIFAGTIDGAFKPNDPITRAQMAAVLDRTYGVLLEVEGAVTVNGTVVGTDFSTVPGTVTVLDFTGAEAVYQIPANLLVQFGTEFLTADQIQAGDIVELYVEDGIVTEAAIYADAPEDSLQPGLQQVKIEAELADGTEFELAYRFKKGKESGSIEIEGIEEKTELKGIEALAEIAEYLEAWQLTPEMTATAFETAVAASFTSEIEELEAKVQFADGTKLKVDDEDEEDDESPETGFLGVTEFEVSVVYLNSNAYKAKYKNEDGEADAEIVSAEAGNEFEISDSEAVAHLEAWLTALNLSSDVEPAALQEAVAAIAGITVSETAEFKVEVTFADGEKVKSVYEVEEVENEDDEENEEETETPAE